MKAALLLFLLLSPLAAQTPSWKLSMSGMITDPVLNEVSGIASSGMNPERLWVLNDSGNKAALYNLSAKGELLGAFLVEGAENRDWEDLASFGLGGKNYLLIADTGDNQGRRKNCCLYLVEEPPTAPVSGKVAPVAVLPFSYEDGPKDVEAVGVDAGARKILLLSKREKVISLYELPLLLKDPSAPLVARKIASMDSLPQPTEEDRKANPVIAPYLGQVTGMDISADGSDLAVLTYQKIYVYHRKPGESWPEAVARNPQVLPRHNLLQAESVCFSRNGKIIYVTTERKMSTPLLRYDRIP